MRTFTMSLASIFVVAIVAPAYAQSANAGRAKAAQVCNVCHGENGMSQQPNAPNLAGQPAIYTAEQLKAYRSGKRSNEIMAVMAKPLTDQEIDDLAAWFESIKVTVLLPK